MEHHLYSVTSRFPPENPPQINYFQQYFHSVSHSSTLMTKPFVLVTTLPVHIRILRVNHVMTIFTLAHSLLHVVRCNRKFIGRQQGAWKRVCTYSIVHWEYTMPDEHHRRLCFSSSVSHIGRMRETYHCHKELDLGAYIPFTMGPLSLSPGDFQN